MSASDSASITDGLFYGGIAYVFSYLYVYLQFVGSRSGFCRRLLDTRSLSELAGESSSLELLLAAWVSACKELGVSTVPTWKRAGWVYHYSKGGSIGWTMNVVPVNVTVPGILIVPEDHYRIIQIRRTVLTDPANLPAVVSATPGDVASVQGPGGAINVFAAMDSLSLVTVTPTALVVAGAVLAYRNGETTPVGGAIAGAKVTAGFLLLSVAGSYLFDVTVSGLTLSAEAFGQIGPEDIGGAAGLSLGGEADLVITGGPSLGRAILTGTVYPLVFGVMGGAAGGKVGVLKSLYRTVTSTNVFDE